MLFFSEGEIASDKLDFYLSPDGHNRAAATISFIKNHLSLGKKPSPPRLSV